jgi:membrane protein DedA with SNARE-associated domain
MAAPPSAQNAQAPSPYLLTAFLLMMGGRVAGAALSPMLLAHAPLALLVVSPVLAHMVVVAALASPLAYGAVVLPVSIGHCLLGYALGRTHGTAAVRWLIERRVLTEGRAATLLSPIRKAAPLVVLAIPGPVVCTLAGASVSSPRVFVPAMVLSQILWASLCWAFGAALLDGIAALRAEVAHHALPLTLVTVAIVAFVRFWRRR